MEFFSRWNVVSGNHGCWSLHWNKKEPCCARKEKGRGRWKLEPNWSGLFHSWQKGSSRSLQPSRVARELRSKLKKEKKKNRWNWNRHEQHWSGLEEFSVLFLYSCILMSLFQVKIKKKNSYGNFGFFKKVSSHSRINSSSSITTSE